MRRETCPGHCPGHNFESGRCRSQLRSALRAGLIRTNPAHLGGQIRPLDRAGPAGELADHVSVVLRYLSAVPAGPGRKALLEDGLVPALDKMLAAPLDPENVYRSVLAALREEVA